MFVVSEVVYCFSCVSVVVWYDVFRVSADWNEDNLCVVTSFFDDWWIEDAYKFWDDWNKRTVGSVDIVLPKVITDGYSCMYNVISNSMIIHLD